MTYPSLRRLTRRRTTRLAALVCLVTWTAGCAEQAIVASSGPTYEIVGPANVVRGTVQVFDENGRAVDIGQVAGLKTEGARFIEASAPAVNTPLVFEGTPVAANEIRYTTMANGDQGLFVRGKLLVTVAGSGATREVSVLKDGIVRARASLTAQWDATASAQEEEPGEEWDGDPSSLEGKPCWQLLLILTAAGITAGAKCAVALVNPTNAAACVLAIAGIDAIIDKLQEGNCFPFYDPRPCLYYLAYVGNPAPEGMCPW